MDPDARAITLLRVDPATWRAKAICMSTSLRTSHAVALAVALLPLTAALSPALAIVTGQATTSRAAPHALGGTGAIIPLPLTPVVPATQRSCTLRTPSGLGYTVLRAGAGAKPAAADTVLVNYIGYLAATGAVFDQNIQSPLPVSGVIPGFAEGLQLVPRTGIVRLCIPAALGYGAKASGPIPAGSDLVFQVELLDFKTPAELEALRKGAEPGAPTNPAPQP
ncbi:FKBP-type peptidyl-prolyl cis-trans isomerase FkpA [Sphingomonas endophytica]|uniref:Peptidyl-prolyl cis-trans isomerase n=1 Tax=Sphingomonas endophytica TaxID=869719 RepID=A0A7X0JBX1_9SPHN|nr:FKBP-type peptidyl-prolyl cis-trans isomerase [Sphingomonas endophytica]MBB6503772.1 FKBP-type peptidyl-prolyl cis-trans isomerase FkpA [Sphingomonas endophytica]